MTLHCVAMGDPAKPLLLCLHGFPEFWRAWADVAARLSADFHVVMPDQRGFNLSSKPEGVAAYATRHLVADAFALADQLSPDTPFLLAGHDWGSAVAYAMAFSRPDRIAKLIVANGVHPVCFQRAILEDEGQRAASQYMTRLRAPDAAELMSADGFARTLGMIERFSSAHWLTPELRAAYIEAYRQPGALEAMLNWYRASPIIVPGVDEAAGEAPLLDLPVEAVLVRMPHLVLWGQDDQALTPACLEGLETYAADLTVRRIDGASHWILHERPDRVAEEIAAFIAAS